MIRVHERVLTEVRREALAERDAYRKALDGERRRLSVERDAYRKALDGERRRLSRYRSVARPAEHREVLRQAKQMAREGLDAHRRALEQNLWILHLVALYERLLNARRAQKKKAEAKQPVAQELLSPSAAS